MNDPGITGSEDASSEDAGSEGAGSERLIAALRSNEPNALATLFDAYADRLFRYCWFALRNTDIAQIALRDTLVAAAAHAGRLADPSQLSSWLYALARVECRRRRPVPPSEADEPPARPNQPDADSRLMAWNAVTSMNPGAMELLDLACRHDVDLGLVLGVSAPEVRAMLDQARHDLERALGAEILVSRGSHACPDRAEVLRSWTGTMTPRLRDQVLRHAVGCRVCGPNLPRNVSAARVFALLPLVSLPADARSRVLAFAADPAAVPYRDFAIHRAGNLDPTGFPRPLAREASSAVPDVRPTGPSARHKPPQTTVAPGASAGALRGARLRYRRGLPPGRVPNGEQASHAGGLGSVVFTPQKMLSSPPRKTLAAVAATAAAAAVAAAIVLMGPGAIRGPGRESNSAGGSAPASGHNGAGAVGALPVNASPAQGPTALPPEPRATATSNMTVFTTLTKPLPSPTRPGLGPGPDVGPVPVPSPPPPQVPGRVVSASPPPASPGQGSLVVYPGSISLGAGSQAQIVLTAEGGQLTWTAGTSSTALLVSGYGGQLKAGQSVTLLITVNRQGDEGGNGLVYIDQGLPGAQTVKVCWSGNPPTPSPTPTPVQSSSPPPSPSPSPSPSSGSSPPSGSPSATAVPSSQPSPQPSETPSYRHTPPPRPPSPPGGSHPPGPPWPPGRSHPSGPPWPPPSPSPAARPSPSPAPPFSSPAPATSLTGGTVPRDRRGQPRSRRPRPYPALAGDAEMRR